MIPNEIFRIIRFIFVGGIATLVHISVVFLLTYYTPLHPVISNSIAFLVAFCVSSSGHLFFTFRVKDNVKSRLAKLFIISVSALALSNSLLAFLLHMGIRQYIAQLAAILFVPCVTYAASRLWAFKPA